MKGAVTLALLACLVGTAMAQPFEPGTGFAPLGNLLTSDQDGPYNLTLVPTQVAEIRAGLAARQNYTALDIINFLTNVECLEGLFDTWGTFGRGFIGNLSLGGPVPKGAQKANLTQRTLPYLEEVALNEQGHALLTRALGGKLPCPTIDFTGGFNDFFAAAYGLNGTVEATYGAPFNPFLNDVNFVLSVLTLEELGATGNKGLALLVNNPVHADAISGLATSATAQATVERFVLWEMRNETVHPFNETVQQAFARVSALRDSLDGPQFDDQGLVNTDPRFIAVPDTFVNLIPTDVHGLTLTRTPQQLINILTLGSPDGKGAFFPDGLVGRINKPTGFNATASDLNAYPAGNSLTAPQEPVGCAGDIPGPITAAGPTTVEGEQQLTQSLGGPLATAGPENRGLDPVPSNGTVNTNGGMVMVGIDSCSPGETLSNSSAADSSGSPAGRKFLLL